MDQAVRSLERRLARTLRDTCERHALLASGDRVLVALSGGKDSYTMVRLLAHHVRARGNDVALVVVHLDQAQPGYDGTPLVRWLEASGLAFEILREDTYSVVTEKTEPGGTYCALCSRLRRGILYSAAERLGCNKVALGHHRDDGLETFLLNLLYGGKLQAMPPKFTTDDGRFEVIRPLVDCAEKDIAAYAAAQAFPILPCKLCGSEEGNKRDYVTRLLEDLERDNPHVRAIMATALGNVRPTHLLDPEVRDAWAARPAEVRPISARATQAHFEALPVTARRLPVL